MFFITSPCYVAMSNSYTILSNPERMLSIYFCHIAWAELFPNIKVLKNVQGTLNVWLANWKQQCKTVYSLNIRGEAVYTRIMSIGVYKDAHASALMDANGSGVYVSKLWKAFFKVTIYPWTQPLDTGWKGGRVLWVIW